MRLQDSTQNEPAKRVIINELLKESDWILIDSNNIKKNVEYEVSNKSGSADYVLYDDDRYPLCIIEAKANEPLDGKEQARGYSKSLNCRFVILSNGHQHYFWDTELGNPQVIDKLPSQIELINLKNNFNPKKELFKDDIIENDYVALTQFPNYNKDPKFIEDKTRENFILDNQLIFLRNYQLQAILAVQKSLIENNSRFLLEMATGTGKTVISTAIIRFFLRSTNVKRVLFLVDRLELEGQADREFKQILKNDFSISVWKENKSDWNRSQIVVSTIQSLISQNRYKRIFDPSDFDLIISDEAHRSLGGKSRKVFEYFNGYKLGLTATPKDYLKSVDIKKLGLKNPKALEKRKLLDTYTTFGCQSGEPTFRYSLVDGVSDGYLVNPKTFDIRTNISTQLLSDDGYYFSGYDDDGNPVEDDISAKKFEKKYFNEKTNISFCKSFLENAKKDPFSGEIGKSIIFCISQKHASKITQILNEFADQMYPGQYQSDFALQITSNITNPNPQKMTKQFRNNSLNGNSNYNNAYKTSKTRICVTVGMMTTGYDCRDILNIGLMRPIFSPADFIQMKGRGTRIFDFKDMWKDKEVMPNLANTKKDCFHLIDFFGNYKYFEEEYEYDTSLDLPKITKPSTEKDPSLTPSFSGKITDLALDDIDTIAEYQHEDGMKIDRMFFNEFSKTIKEDHSELKEMILNHNFDDAADYLIKNILNKPERYFTMENLQEALQLDRNLTPKELLQYIFDLIPNIPSKKECLEEDFEKFDDLFQPDKEDFDNIKHIFKAYIDNKTVKSIIDNKEYAKFNHHPSGRYFKNLSKKYKEEIPSYINKFVDLNKYAN